MNIECNRTFEDWWNNLPNQLQEDSLKITDTISDCDDYTRTKNKINYVLYHLDLFVEKEKKPTFEEFRYWFYSGQIK